MAILPVCGFLRALEHNATGFYMAFLVLQIVGSARNQAHKHPHQIITTLSGQTTVTSKINQTLAYFGLERRQGDFQRQQQIVPE
jgi:hypothetical protein